MDDTAATIYTELRSLADRLTELQRARLLTIDGNPAGTRDAVQDALTLLDRAADKISQLETLDLR